MQPLLRLARLGLGGPLGLGRQFWPWITLVDEVGALLHLLDHPEVTGPVNLCRPAPARQQDVAAAIGRALHRPALLPAPSPALRLVVGEFAGEILGSQRIVGEALVASGYVHPRRPRHRGALARGLSRLTRPAGPRGASRPAADEVDEDRGRRARRPAPRRHRHRRPGSAPRRGGR